jgi:hypothetical protein
MSHKFKGTIQNAFRPEGGVNITVKGLEKDKVILAPTGFAFDFDKKQDGATLSFTLTPSSGGTEGREVKVEVNNGKEKVTPSAADWQVEITSSDKSKPTEVNVAIITKMA